MDEWTEGQKSVRPGRDPRRFVRLAGLLGATLLCAAAAPAQRSRIETFTIDDGLPSATVLQVAQDPSGRLWLLTQAGASVYDGHAFATFGRGDGLSWGELGALTVDAEGRVWVSTRWQGPYLSWFDGLRWQGLPEPDPRMPPARGRSGGISLLAVIPGEDGPERSLAAAAGPEHELWLWDGNAWSHDVAGLPSKGFKALTVYDGTIAAGTTSGLCLLTPSGADCPGDGRDPRLAEPILALAAEPPAGLRQSTRLWLLSLDWLGYLEEERLTIVADGLPLGSFAGWLTGAIAVDEAGGVYFGNQGTAFFLAPEGSRQEIGIREGLASEGATSFLLDREGNVWVGALRGLSRIGRRRFLSYSRDQGLLEDEVSAAVETASGEIVLAHSKGLSFVGPGGIDTLTFPAASCGPHASCRILDTARGQDGATYLAANELGLLRVDGRSLQTVLVKPVLSVESDASGRLWASSYGELLLDEGAGFSPVEHGQDVSHIRWLTTGPEEELYAGTTSGLVFLDERGWHLARGASGGANNVYAVFVRRSGEVWIGTGAGLSRLLDGQIVASERPAIDRPVYFILGDGEGRHWFGTDDGVLIWDGSAVDGSSVEGSSLRQLSFQHGLAGRETNRGAALVDRRGRVWIGTVRGVSVYQKEYDTPPQPPRVELTAVEVNGEERPLDGELRLAHRENNLTFRYTTITFADEGEVLVRYSLDEERLTTSPSSGVGIRYTHVPPGTYRFRIAAGWARGPWSAEVLSPAITVVRPLWQRPWFYVLALAAVAGAIVGVHRMRVRSISRRATELLALNAKLNESIEQRDLSESERQRLIDDLERKNEELERFTHTVSHDLKSPLVTIKGFLGFVKADLRSGEVDRAERDLAQIEGAANKMARLLDDLLELSRVGQVADASQIVALGDIAREATELLAAEIAERGAAVEIAGDLPVVTGDRTRLLQVFQNLVKNSVKYMGDEEEPRIEIGLKQDGDVSVVFVRDNGLGVDPQYHETIFGLFQRLDYDSEGTGIGLSLVRRIVEVHGGQVWVESEGRGQGACFCFTVGEAE